jgi:hypothetical protein
LKEPKFEPGSLETGFIQSTGRMPDVLLRLSFSGRRQPTERKASKNFDFLKCPNCTTGKAKTLNVD